MISRTFYANIRWLWRPCPWPGAEAVTRFSLASHCVAEIASRPALVPVTRESGLGGLESNQLILLCWHHSTGIRAGRLGTVGSMLNP